MCPSPHTIAVAVDSIPAVLAINNDPFVIYTSNIAAVVGLRSLYQLLSVAVSDLIYLEKARERHVSSCARRPKIHLACVHLASRAQCVACNA